MPNAPVRILIATLLVLARPTVAVEVTGAGSTFVFPLMAKWALAYRAVTGDIVNYQSIGSGGGIKQIENGTVDFGATDMPLEADELDRHHLIQIPLISGAVVPAVHLRGIADAELRMDGPTLTDIFAGRLTRWSDPRLTAPNPGVPLPDRLITVVHRADQSGTTFIWTSFLNQTGSAWPPGAVSAPRWPVGVGGKGNEGVASFVKNIDGAIGYIESAFAIQARMTTVRLKSRTGEFVALADAGSDWPITGMTYVLLRADRDAEPGPRAARAFVDWALLKGADSARALHYIPLPARATR